MRVEYDAGFDAAVSLRCKLRQGWLKRDRENGLRFLCREICQITDLICNF